MEIYSFVKNNEAETAVRGQRTVVVRIKDSFYKIKIISADRFIMLLNDYKNSENNEYLRIVLNFIVMPSVDCKTVISQLNYYCSKTEYFSDIKEEEFFDLSDENTDMSNASSHGVLKYRERYFIFYLFAALSDVGNIKPDDILMNEHDDVTLIGEVFDKLAAKGYFIGADRHKSGISITELSLLDKSVM